MAFAFVASSAKTVYNAASGQTLALTINAMGATSNMLAGVATNDSGGSDVGDTVTSVSDNGTGGTWVVKQNVNDATNQQNSASVYGYGWSVTPTTVTVSFTNTGSTFPTGRGFGLMEFSGPASGNPIDGTNFQGLNTQAPGTGANGAKSGAGNLTPAAANYLVVGLGVLAGALANGSSFFAAGTGFTKPTGGEHSTNGDIGFAMEYQIQTTATAVNASWTCTSNTAETTLMMIFKVAAAGGGSPLFRQSLLNGLGSGGPFFNNPLGRHRQPRQQEWARKDRIFVPRHVFEGRLLEKAA